MTFLFGIVGLGFLAAVCYFAAITFRDSKLSPRPWLYRLGATFAFAWMLNFVVFWNVALWIGGDAWSGKVENGQHFLSSHGEYTEVSEAVWKYSYAHVVCVVVTFPLGMIGVGILNSKEAKIRQ